MTTARSMSIFVIASFLLGFGLGGLSLHVASAQGLLGIKTHVSQIGSALVEMQKNVDELQKKHEHDQTGQRPIVFAAVGGRCHGRDQGFQAIALESRL